MAMKRRDLLLDDGRRALRHEVKRQGHEWHEPRIIYCPELLARAVDHFTASATMYGAPLRRYPPTIITLAL